MHKRINAFLSGVVDHPWLGTLLVIALTAGAIIGYVNPQLVWDLWKQPESTVEAEQDTGSDRLSNGAARPAPNVQPLRLGDADSILLIESDQIFTPAGMRALRETVDRLERLPQVNHVMWMDRVPIVNIFGLPEPVYPRGSGSDTLLAASREKALAHPLVKGQLLSPDGRFLQLLITFDWLYVDDDARVTEELVTIAREVIADEPQFEATVHLTGRVPLYLASWRSSNENQLRYQLVGYSVIGIAALILFRGPIAVFIVALGPALGVFWTLGYLRFLDLDQNPFNDVILPTLLSLVGLTDGVHLMVQIRHYRAEGMEPRDAARTGAREVGVACVLTSVTTAIGFGSLGLADHEVVREFGWCCVVGVFLTLISILTVIPLACATVLGRRVHAGHHTGVVQKHLRRIGVFIDFAAKHNRSMSWVAIASTVLLTIVAFQLSPDERRQQGLPRSSPAVQALQRMDQAFGGLETATVEIQWDESVEAESDELLTVLKEAHAVLADEPLIGHPLSLESLIATLPGGGAGGERLVMAELLPPPLRRAFHVPEQRIAIILFRVQDLGIARYAEVFERVTERLEQIASNHPGYRLRLEGSAVFRWRNLYRIVVDLASSLGAACVIIFIVLGLVYRSVRIGLISVVPNVFPLVLTATMLVAFGQGLEVVSVCAFTVCLGIAVDDTIHFITRYLECREAGLDQEQAIHEAFVGVGTALITTTVVLVAGFTTVLLSDSREHVIFASMGIVTFLSALFADLVFLPALLVRYSHKR